MPPLKILWHLGKYIPTVEPIWSGVPYTFKTWWHMGQGSKKDGQLNPRRYYQMFYTLFRNRIKIGETLLLRAGSRLPPMSHLLPTYTPSQRSHCRSVQQHRTLVHNTCPTQVSNKAHLSNKSALNSITVTVTLSLKAQCWPQYFHSVLFDAWII